MSASFLLNGDPSSYKIDPIFLGEGKGDNLNSVLKNGNDAEGLGMVNVSSITANAKIGSQNYQYYPQVVLNSGTDIIPAIEAPVIDNSQLIAVHGFNNDVGFRNIPALTALGVPTYCCVRLEGDDVVYFGGETGVWAYQFGTDNIYKVLTTYSDRGVTVGGSVYSLSLIYKNTVNGKPIICAGGDFKATVWIQQDPYLQEDINITMAEVIQYDSEYLHTVVFPDAQTPYPTEPVYAIGANDTGVATTAGFLWGGLASNVEPYSYQGMGFISTYGQFTDALNSLLMAWLPAFLPDKSVFTIKPLPTANYWILGGDFNVTSADAGTVTTGICAGFVLNVVVIPAQPVPKLQVAGVFTPLGGANYLTVQAGAGNYATCRSLCITGDGSAGNYIVACGAGIWSVAGAGGGNLTDTIAYIGVSAGIWTILSIPAPLPNVQGYSCCATVYNGTKVAIGAYAPVADAWIWNKTTPATVSVKITADGQGLTNTVYFITPYSPYEFFCAEDITQNTAGKSGQRYVFPDGETFTLSALANHRIFFVPKGWGSPPSATADLYNTITVADYGTVFSMLGDVAQGGVWRMMSSSDQAGVQPSNV
jgi:hypothetical protein